jgi:hypothetical protein
VVEERGLHKKSVLGVSFSDKLGVFCHYCSHSCSGARFFLSEVSIGECSARKSEALVDRGRQGDTFGCFYTVLQ